VAIESSSLVDVCAFVLQESRNRRRRNIKNRFIPYVLSVRKLMIELQSSAKRYKAPILINTNGGPGDKRYND